MISTFILQNDGYDFLIAEFFIVYIAELTGAFSESSVKLMTTNQKKLM